MDAFTPTWLYVKRCNHCGLLYFGKTTNKNPHTYKGSGTLWLRHIRKHGVDQVTTVKAELFVDRARCMRVAINFANSSHD